MSAALHWLGMAGGVFGAICLGCFVAVILCCAWTGLRTRHKARKETPPRWRSRLPLPLLRALACCCRPLPPAETPGEPLSAREQRIFAAYQKENR